MTGLVSGTLAWSGGRGDQMVGFGRPRWGKKWRVVGSSEPLVDAHRTGWRLGEVTWSRDRVVEGQENLGLPIPQNIRNPYPKGLGKLYFGSKVPSELK